MRYLRWIGLMSSLLIVGVLGGLMAPLASGAESLPIVTVYEVASGVTYTTNFATAPGGTNCTTSPAPPTGFICYSLTSIPFSTTVFAANSRWKVGSVASNNQARVLVKDSDTATDNMYLSGISITSNVNASSTTNVATQPGPCSVCLVGHMTLRKTFDLGSGNVAGPFNWAVHVGGNFNAPDFTENVVNDRMRLTGKGCFTLGCNPDTGISVGTVDTTVTTSPITLGGQGGLTRDTGPTQFGSCNTGSNRCKQTIKYDYAFTVQGRDLMNLTDSATGCGGTCNPGVKAKGQLPACGDPNTAPEEGEEPSLLYQCAQQLAGDSKADNQSNLATGGVPAEVCGSTCIVILLEGTPPGTSVGAGPFTFTATGVSPSSFDMTLNPQAEQVKTFSNLQPDPLAGDRTFIITDYPPGGAQGDFQLDQVHCRTTLGSTCRIVYDGSGNSKTKIGVTVTNLVVGDAFILEMHVH